MFGRKKTTTVDKRLQELQREMAKVQNEMKILSRYEKDQEKNSPGKISLGKIFPLPSVKPRFAAAEPKELKETPPGPTPSSIVADSLLSTQKEDQTGSSPGSSSSGAGGGDLPLFEPRPPLSNAGREKFANYFMAGHFHNLRPLRLEKRIVRNKAIVMIVLVVLALIWLFFLLSSQ